ncbi:MAG: hypothetical protein PUP46_10000 [Endozoicomonas sp. (ex Botrylloides leachii)]|nr:hypothetical protein [Endozoicomonas sp. (ex Botrylloides leachii)]
MSFIHYLPFTKESYRQIPIVENGVRNLDDSSIGDIGIYFCSNKYRVKHAVIVGSNPPWVTHSIYKYGVYSSKLQLSRPIIFFRLKCARAVALKAAQIAQNWSRGFRETRQDDFDSVTTEQVGFSSSMPRGVTAFMGSSAFGSGASRRLDKYRRRESENFAPKYVICSEMVILAYQLAAFGCQESKGFIMLDAKHSLPGTLAQYLYESPFWELTARSKAQVL